LTAVTKSFIYAIMLALNLNFYTVLNYDAWLILQQFINSLPQFMQRWSIPTSSVLLSIQLTVWRIKAKHVDCYSPMRRNNDMLRITNRNIRVMCLTSSSELIHFWSGIHAIRLLQETKHSAHSTYNILMTWSYYFYLKIDSTETNHIFNIVGMHAFTMINFYSNGCNKIKLIIKVKTSLWMPWKHMSEWSCVSIYSWFRQCLEVNGLFHASTTLTSGKGPQDL
jgi:hypothetical protein